MKLRTSPYKTPSKAARLALALAAARAIVILQELKREQPLVLIKLLQTSALAVASRAESPTPARATAPVERSEALG